VAYYAVDAMNFLTPTATSWIGGQFFAPVSAHFASGQDEQTGYLGLPVLLLLATILADPPLRRALWLPLSMFGLLLLASLGSALHAAGHDTGLILPWALIIRLPLLGEALPARCMVYAFLLLGIILSQWVRAQPGRLRVLIAAGICLSLLPAPHPAPAAPMSAFFRPGRVQQKLGPHPTLLILPFGINGPSSFWQAENEFGFDQVGGYLGYPPGWAQNDPAMTQLLSGKLDPGFAQDIARLCQLRGAQYIVAGPGADTAMVAAIASLHWPAQKIDDVTIFTVPQTLVQQNLAQPASGTK
jgi:hypothetical protein